MEKWYENKNIDNDVIISSRIRLARNFKNYPFSLIINDENAYEMIRETVSAVQNPQNTSDMQLSWVDINTKNDIQKHAMLAKHIISPEFIAHNKPRGLLVAEDDAVSIMINEEDHIRMQTITPGDNMDEAWKIINRLDDKIEQNIEYAFDRDYGYLTSCPTNVGTGMRASYMVHVPLLEKTGQFQNIVSVIGKFGMTVRGIYGEGTEPMGSIYQISNQVTIGKTETEIIKSLQSVTEQIITKEKILRDKIIAEQHNELEDIVYRAYGILTNCRRITNKEAVKLLSDIRLGYISGILKEEHAVNNIYYIMMSIQPATLQVHFGREMDDSQRDIFRAQFIRDSIFSNK